MSYSRHVTKFSEGKNLTKHELKKLRSLYQHLQLEYPDLPDVIGDHPEDLLAKLGYYVHGAGTRPGDNVDWNLAYNKGKLVG